ncbi:MAG: metal ABC transporter substrate-binding protein [Lachnospiraceae bacterium]|nr:metal ABC transporter substrate-binding protein [Lachnospiraceae bacterium]
MRLFIKRTGLLVLAIFILCIGGCSKNDNNSGKDIKKDNDGITVVTTIFPEYDWTRQILKDNPGSIRLDLLLDSGVDMHSYQPSADDILNISTCDVFIFVGGESEAWVDDVLKNAVNKDMVVVRLMDAIGDRLREEEHVEGMQEDCEEESEPENGEAEYDEHIWLSLKNAKICCHAIADALSKVDSKQKDYYEANLKLYESILDELDGQYREVVKTADKDTLLFADRFPFRYMTEDYGLKYFAAFSGCSAETEASFETIAFLAAKADELSLNTILIIDGSDGKIAKTVINSSNNKERDTAVLDSMQSVTKKDMDDGAAYLDMMNKNLDVLKKVLN